nr:SagB/ThcOx family dehydrogenase [Paenarthrobacter nitroguajacolicus]
MACRSSERIRRRVITPQLVEDTLRAGQGLPATGRRAYPSPGGTYSVSLAWIGFRGNPAVGIATLQPDGTVGWEQQAMTLESGENLLRVSAFPAATAQGAFLLTGDLESVGQRYGERGYRYMLLEAGHIAQNLVLALSLQGIASCPIGAFDDQVANELLGHDKDSLNLPVYTIALP